MINSPEFSGMHMWWWIYGECNPIWMTGPIESLRKVSDYSCCQRRSSHDPIRIAQLIVFSGRPIYRNVSGLLRRGQSCREDMLRLDQNRFWLERTGQLRIFRGLSIVMNAQCKNLQILGICGCLAHLRKRGLQSVFSLRQRQREMR